MLLKEVLKELRTMTLGLDMLDAGEGVDMLCAIGHSDSAQCLLGMLPEEACPEAIARDSIIERIGSEGHLALCSLA